MPVAPIEFVIIKMCTNIQVLLNVPLKTKFAPINKFRIENTHRRGKWQVSFYKNLMHFQNVKNGNIKKSYFRNERKIYTVHEGS